MNRSGAAAPETMDVDNAFASVVEREKVNLAGFTLIEGFPGMGLVGTISVKYLTEKLGFVPIGYLKTNLFLPVVRIHHGYPLHACQLFYQPKLKLVTLVSEQIVPNNRIALIAGAVVEWVKEKKIRRVVSLSGIQVAGEEAGETADEVYGFASNAGAHAWLEKHKIKVIQEGVTTGINALVLLELLDEDIEGACLLGKVKISADYAASATLLKKLKDMLGLDISLEPLLAEAKQTEKEIVEHLQKVKDVSAQAQEFEDQVRTGSDGPPMFT